MKTKLTLSIDKELVPVARAQAHTDGKSVSRLFSDFLRARQAREARQSLPKIDDMVGSLKRYGIDDSKTGVRAAYAQKHSGRP